MSSDARSPEPGDPEWPAFKDRLIREGFGFTDIHLAAGDGNTEHVEALLRAGAPVNERAAFGSTPLDMAVSGGHLQTMLVLILAGAEIDFFTVSKAATRGSPTVLAALRAAGGDLTASSLDGTTPLHWSAMEGHSVAVTYLLEAGADPNAREHREGSTPLHHAVEFGHIDVVAALLQAGADPNLANDDGDTPRNMAWGEVQAVLRRAGHPAAYRRPERMR